MTSESPIEKDNLSMEEDENFHSAEDEPYPAVPTIPTSSIQEKLRALASFSTPALVTEIRRLASLSIRALQREFELREHIHKLPLEILGEIFALGQDMEVEAELSQLHRNADNNLGLEQDLHIKSHLTAAQVCQRWRGVVLSTGKLWRRISIRAKESWEWTQMCFDRSGDAPLSITINWMPDEDEVPPESPISPTQRRKMEEAKTLSRERYSAESLSKIFTSILPYAHRWEFLALVVNTYQTMFGALQILSTVDAPMLIGLELVNHDDIVVGETFEPKEYAFSFDLLRGPSGSLEPTPLKHGKFWGVYADWSSNIFSSLTNLTLAYHSDDVRPSAETFFGILENSKETLFHLSLECSGPQKENKKDYGWPEEPIFLPKLRRFKVAFLPPEYVQRIITTFEAPYLDQIEFDLVEDDGDVEDWNRVIEVLCTGTYIKDTSSHTSTSSNKSATPLFPSIQSAKLSSFPADPTHLGIFLYSHPLIKNFAINFHFLPEEFLYFLTASTTDILKADDLVLPRWTPQALRQYMEIVRQPEWKGPEEYLLPKLTLFKAYNLESHSIRYMVEVRQKAGLPLKQVYYSDGSPVYRQDRIWLKRNLEVFSEFEDTDDEDEEEEDEEESEDEEEDDLLGNDDDEEEEEEEEEDNNQQPATDEDGEWVDDDGP